MEFPDVNMVLDGYSARVIREWYTHIGGMPTRLQSSTRYVKWNGQFEENFVMAPKIKDALDSNADLRTTFNNFVDSFQILLKQLEQANVPNEDAALFYPLGITTQMTCKHHIIDPIDMSHQRLCALGYHDTVCYLEMYSCNNSYSDEWAWFVIIV